MTNYKENLEACTKAYYEAIRDQDWENARNMAKQIRWIGNNMESHIDSVKGGIAKP